MCVKWSNNTHCKFVSLKFYWYKYECASASIHSFIVHYKFFSFSAPSVLLSQSGNVLQNNRVFTTMTHSVGVLNATAYAMVHKCVQFTWKWQKSAE